MDAAYEVDNCLPHRSEWTRWTSTLLMCLGELRTAAREGFRIVVIVFADGTLSLNRLKRSEV